MKRLLLVGLLGVGLIAGAAHVYAAGAYDWKLTTRNDTDTADVTNQFIPSDTYYQILVNEFGTRTPQLYTMGDEFFVNPSSKQVIIQDLPEARVTNLVSDLAGKADTASVDTVSAALSSLSATVSGIATPLNIAAFMGNNASTTPYIASSTQNGFMSAADKAKMDAMTAPSAWTWNTPSRSLTTGTGATGFQPSSSRVSSVHYNVRVTTTASIAGNADGYITLEVAPTNSATAGDWVEMGRCGNSQALSLAITLQSVQGTSCQLNADVPVGYYAKLRSVTTTGTVSFASLSGSEVLK